MALNLHDEKNKWLDWAIEIQSLAQAGMTYGHDVYDLERYERLREISAEMLSYKTDIPVEKVKDLFCSETGYQTPKVDTRAAIFEDGKILTQHKHISANYVYFDPEQRSYGLLLHVNQLLLMSL